MVATQSGTELTFCLVLMEVSNPFLHARFLMKVSMLGIHNDLKQRSLAQTRIQGPYILSKTAAVGLHQDPQLFEHSEVFPWDSCA